MWLLDSLRRPQLAWPLPGLDPDRLWRRRRATVSGELLAMLALGLLAAIGLLAERQYADLRASVQAAEMNRLVTEFRSGPVADAWRTLHDAWQRESPRQSVLLSRLTSLSGDRFGATLHDYRQFVLETVEEHHLARAVTVTFGFFKQLALCVRVGHCPHDVARNAFGAAAWQFRNQHYYYFESELSVAELDQTVRIIAASASSVAADVDAMATP